MKLVDQPLPGMPEAEGMGVHPVAGLFPMLAEDELAELAADIKQRGQLQPIVLDTEGRILDGRNRLAACRLVGVEPKFDYYTGDDPDGYAAAVNITRRHLTKGQRAMLMALSGYKNYTEAEISKQYVSWARTVAAQEDLVPGVLDGTTPLAKAYEVAAARKQRESERQTKLTELRAGAPDLLARVEDETLSLSEALGAMAVRNAEAKAAAELADRVADLPGDLAERVSAGTLGIDEAETVVKQRSDRLATWAEKVTAALETLVRMAGNPIPADLAGHLTDREINHLSAILGALKQEEPNG